MRIALYARVSTSDKGQDPEMQLRELREYCERRQWTITSEFVDIGVSGAKESRPETQSPDGRCQKAEIRRRSVEEAHRSK